MFVVAAKAGFGFVVILTILGIMQSQTIADMIVGFMAAGLLPGTSLQIPAEPTLIGVAGVLMMLVAWLFRVYISDRTCVQAASQDFPNFSEDPAFDVLIPGLRRVVRARRGAEAAANNVSLGLYLWLRSLGRPVIAQAIVIRKGLAASFVRFDAPAAGKAELLAFAENAASALKAGVSYGRKTWNDVSEKARYYLVKFILS